MLTFLICVSLTQLKIVNTLPLKLLNETKVMSTTNPPTNSTPKVYTTPTSTPGEETPFSEIFGHCTTSSRESSLSSQTESPWCDSTPQKRYRTPPRDPRLHPLRHLKCRKRLRFTSPELSCLYSPGGQHKRFRGLRYIDEVEKYYRC